MSKATLGLAFFAVFVIGALIGRVTSPSELKAAIAPKPSSLSSSASREAPEPDPRAPIDEALDRRAVRTERVRPVVDVGAAPLVTAERVIELEREVTRLRSLVDEHKAIDVEVGGTAVAFPEGRTAKGDEQALHEALRKALAAHGLVGDVKALDCSEFPCIAHGRVNGVDDVAMQAVIDDAKRAVGGAPYASVSKFVDAKDPAKAFSSFSLALFPEDLPAPEQENLNKRLRNRKNAYVDATAGE
ncbi:MAG: hypothetical protein Q8O67_14350 [Deltaproteobacteria bacterium]|nr:hypothetical protein [Deltaproteobacteria bacterium]